MAPISIEKVEKEECESFKPLVLTKPQIFHSNSEHNMNLRSRTLDFADLKGAMDYSGCTASQFLSFVLKEALDNGAVDKPTTKEISIKIWKESGVKCLLVRDDGQPEFSLENAESLTDFGSAPSTKRGIHAIRAGVKGNGAQTSLAISDVLWDPNNPNKPKYTFEVWNSSTKFKFCVKRVPAANGGSEKAYATMDQTLLNEDPVYTDGNGGTVVLIRLPEGYYYENPYAVFTDIRLRNPQITFEYNDVESDFFRYFPALTTARRQTEWGYGSPHWYSFREFKELVTEIEDMTTEELIDKFAGFKNRAYRKRAMDAAKVTLGKSIKTLDYATLQKLLDAMKKETRPIKASAAAGSLPTVGDLMLGEHRKQAGSYYQAFYGNYKMAAPYYAKEDEKLVPFIIEVASYLDSKEELREGINFTANLHRPFAKWVYEEDKKTLLSDILKEKGKSVVLNVVCPNIDWRGAAKNELDKTPFETLLLKAVRNAVKQRDLSAAVGKTELVSWAQEAMNAYPGLTFTVRQVFYRLVARKAYPNNRQSYNNLGKALSQARDAGDIDPERIVDLSRPEYMNNARFKKCSQYLKVALENLVKDCDIDRWINQDYFVEIWIEKEALSRVLLPTCRKYHVNLIVGKGYSSDTQIYRAVKDRFPRDGRKMIILYLGDHDPSGLHIEEKLKEKVISKAAKQGVKLIPGANLDVNRIALSFDQARMYKLPSSKLKKASQKAKEYRKKYGENVWELDALDPELLVKKLDMAIRPFINESAWMEKEFEVQDFKEGLKRKVSGFKALFQI